MDRAAFLAKYAAPRIERVEANGEEFFIRALSLAERDRVEAAMLRKQTDGKLSDLEGIRGLLVCLGVCDAAGARVFADGDIAEVESCNAETMMALADKIGVFNGIFGGEDRVKN